MKTLPPILRHGLLALLPAALAACSGAHDGPAVAATPAYAAVARGHIDVEGGLVTLVAPREGSVEAVSAREGTRVRRGEPLLVLESTGAQLQVEAARAELAQSQAQQQLLTGQLSSARERARRLSAAAKAGAADQQSADDAEAGATDLNAQLAAAAAAIATAQAHLQSAEYEVARRTLRAPADAEVVRVLAQPGMSVSPQSGALLTLLPATAHIVRADLSETYLNAVKVGMPATVTTDDDDSPLSARVLRISPVVGNAPVEEDPQHRPVSRTVDCVLALEPASALRYGQRVLVRFGAARAAAKD